MPVFRHALSSAHVYPTLQRGDGSTVVLEPDETIELPRDPEIAYLSPDLEEDADGEGFFVVVDLEPVAEPAPQLANLEPTPAQLRTKRRNVATKPEPAPKSKSDPEPEPTTGEPDPS